MGGRLQLGSDEPGVDAGVPFDRIDVQITQVLDIEDDRTFRRARCPRQGRARALRHDRYAVCLRLLQHRDDVLDIAGAHDREVLGCRWRARAVDGIRGGDVGVADERIAEGGTEPIQGADHETETNAR